jgi:hypothetical protein
MRDEADRRAPRRLGAHTFTHGKGCAELDHEFEKDPSRNWYHGFFLEVHVDGWEEGKTVTMDFHDPDVEFPQRACQNARVIRYTEETATVVLDMQYGKREGFSCRLAGNRPKHITLSCGFTGDMPPSAPPRPAAPPTPLRSPPPSPPPPPLPPPLTPPYRLHPPSPPSVPIFRLSAHRFPSSQEHVLAAPPPPVPPIAAVVLDYLEDSNHSVYAVALLALASVACLSCKLRRSRRWCANGRTRVVSHVCAPHSSLVQLALMPPVLL